MSSTPAPRHKYRWTILGAGVFAQASFSAQVGVVLAALNFGLLATLLPWGMVADQIGERAVLATGLTGCAGALVLAGRTSSFGGLVLALAAAGAFGGGTQSASGRAVMSWFGPEERGLALGIRQTAVPLGGAIASGALPALSTHVSLRAAFYGLAAGCLAAAAVGTVGPRSGSSRRSCRAAASSRRSRSRQSSTQARGGSASRSPR